MIAISLYFWYVMNTTISLGFLFIGVPNHLFINPNAIVPMSSLLNPVLAVCRVLN